MHLCIYVAVTDIDGLFLANQNNDSNFYHRHLCSAPPVKEIRDECYRLEKHPLTRLTGKVRDYINRKSLDCCLVCTINAQRLAADTLDISADELITRPDILAISETWIDMNSRINIDGFELVTHPNRT